MAAPRFLTSRSPSAKENTPANQSAVYSPSERPAVATTSSSLPAARSATVAAADVT
jgi:hypothetical protein